MLFLLGGIVYFFRRGRGAYFFSGSRKVHFFRRRGVVHFLSGGRKVHLFVMCGSHVFASLNNWLYCHISEFQQYFSYTKNNLINSSIGPSL